MIQFIDLEIIKALIILFISSVLFIFSLQAKNKKKEEDQAVKKKSNTKYYWFAYIAFLVMVVFFMADSAKRSAEENVKKFRGAKVLRCSASEQQYRVSKTDGWEVDGFYFVKDSLMIRADKCEEIGL